MLDDDFIFDEDGLLAEPFIEYWAQHSQLAAELAENTVSCFKVAVPDIPLAEQIETDWARIKARYLQYYLNYC